MQSLLTSGSQGAARDCLVVVCLWCHVGQLTSYGQNAASIEARIAQRTPKHRWSDDWRSLNRATNVLRWHHRHTRDIIKIGSKLLAESSFRQSSFQSCFSCSKNINFYLLRAKKHVFRVINPGFVSTPKFPPLKVRPSYMYFTRKMPKTAKLLNPCFMSPIVAKRWCFYQLLCSVQALGNSGESFLPPEMKSSLPEREVLSSGMLVAGQKTSLNMLTQFLSTLTRIQCVCVMPDANKFSQTFLSQGLYKTRFNLCMFFSWIV